MERCGLPLYHVTSGASPRLQLHIPIEIAKVLGENFFQSESLFAEELAQIADACYELETTPEELVGVAVADNLTIRDIFNISRMLRFYAHLRLQEMGRLRETDPAAYRLSLIGGGSAESSLN